MVCQSTMSTCLSFDLHSNLDLFLGSSSKSVVSMLPTTLLGRDSVGKSGIHTATYEQSHPTGSFSYILRRIHINVVAYPFDGYFHSGARADGYDHKRITVSNIPHNSQSSKVDKFQQYSRLWKKGSNLRGGISALLRFAKSILQLTTTEWGD
jgi:hypothetical protein